MPFLILLNLVALCLVLSIFRQSWPKHWQHLQLFDQSLAYCNETSPTPAPISVGLRVITIQHCIEGRMEQLVRKRT